MPGLLSRMPTIFAEIPGRIQLLLLTSQINTNNKVKSNVLSYNLKKNRKMSVKFILAGHSGTPIYLSYLGG